MPRIARLRGLRLASICVREVRPRSRARGRGGVSRDPAGCLGGARGSAIDRFRGGQLNAFDADQVLFHYSRAAKELWKFCNLGDTELAANIVRERPAVDWWEQWGPRKR